MFDPTTFTGFHTWLSIIALVTGVVVIIDLIGGRFRPVWTALFLVTAIATSVTGFGFPFTGVLPSHVVGVISLVALAIVVVSLAIFKLAGLWRLTYVITAGIGVYLLAFVAVAQFFLKIPALQALAPTGAEPPFLIAQLVVLAVFVVAIWAGARGRPAVAG
jgi:hypothetical protein